jgi:hypothetical protein
MLDASKRLQLASRIIGNAGGTVETPRFGHAPHPLF